MPPLSNWWTQQDGVRRDEVSLFRFFAETLAAEHPGVWYREVHGNKGQVQFDSRIYPEWSPVQREISDLIILCFSWKRMEARYTVHQNKLKRSRGTPPTHPAFKFPGDLMQFDLLAHRPLFKSIGGIRFPDNLLNSTSHESVGSYGIFYENGSHLIDFIYAIASWLVPQSLVRYPNLILNSFSQRFSLNGDEVPCTFGIERFTDALLSFKIGAPLLERDVASFFRGVIARLESHAERQAHLPEIPVVNDSEPANPGEGNLRLLLIDVDQTDEDWLAELREFSLRHRPHR